MTRRTRNLSLLLILILTAALWSGVAGIRLNSDDYQYLPSLAPIQNFGAVLRPFVSSDVNPSFFRPVANATMALDFLLFGWSGAAFHLTNLFFHLIATLLVFYFVRDFFRLSERASLWVALAFGIAASHEYNLVVDTARADTLAAVFVLLNLLLLKKSVDKRSILLGIASWLSFMLALLSKESAVLALPLIPILFWEQNTDWKQSIAKAAKRALPFAVITVLFYFYHQHFTEPIAESQPMTAAGAHSLVALLRNGLYSIGYFFLPLDLSSATLLLTKYKSIFYIVGPLAAILGILLLWKFIRKGMWREFAPSFWFSLFTGAVLFLTFERWRLYLPSVGLLAMLAIIIRSATSRIGKSAWLILLVPLGAFHIYRALEAQSDWRASTALLDGLKNNLSQILSTIPNRPVTIGFLDVPAKLGSASVLQLGNTALVQRAEADRINPFNLQTASLDGVNVGSWSAIDVYALDRLEGYNGLEVSRIAPNRYLVSVPLQSNIIFYPATLTSNVVARRDLAMAVGDSVVAPAFVDIVRSVSNGLAKSIEVDVRDSSAYLTEIDSSGTFHPIP